MEDGELRELATAMALTMPLETPEEAALARRVEERQAEWERLWKGVFETRCAMVRLGARRDRRCTPVRDIRTTARAGHRPRHQWSPMLPRLRFRLDPVARKVYCRDCDTEVTAFTALEALSRSVERLPTRAGKRSGGRRSPRSYVVRGNER